MSFLPISKSTAPAYLVLFKHGVAMAISELFSYKQTSPIFLPDTEFKNVTRDSFAAISWSLTSRNSASFANPNKNSTTFSLFIKDGKEPTLEEIQNLTFLSSMFPDGTLVKDATFARLSNNTWVNLAKS